jgi:hypothetical protein
MVYRYTSMIYFARIYKSLVRKTKNRGGGTWNGKQRSKGQEQKNRAIEKETLGRRKEDGRQGRDHVRQGAEDGRQGTDA